LAKQDDGAWSIPKGLIGADEAPLSAARREFAEETGHQPEGVFLPLGETLQPGGKVVQAWAIEGEWDPALIRRNTFEMEWPPRSGRHRNFPEIDRAAWFDVADARHKILMGQAIFVDRLLEVLGPGTQAGVAPQPEKRTEFVDQNYGDHGRRARITST
jgi:predicted NUDIX family NTP pyrophosphohydrolase